MSIQKRKEKRAPARRREREPFGSSFYMFFFFLPGPTLCKLGQPGVLFVLPEVPILVLRPFFVLFSWAFPFQVFLATAILDSFNSSKKTKNKTCWMVYFQGLAFYTCLDLAVTKLLKRSGKRKLQLKSPTSQKNLRAHPATHQLTIHSVYVNSLHSISDKLSSRC